MKAEDINNLYKMILSDHYMWVEFVRLTFYCYRGFFDPVILKDFVRCKVRFNLQVISEQQEHLFQFFCKGMDLQVIDRILLLYGEGLAPEYSFER